MIKNIVRMLLVSLIPIALTYILEFSEESRKELSDFRMTELTFRAEGFEVDAEANKEISYEGKITDTDVITRLWEIIREQQKQPAIKDGNVFGGTPSLHLYAPNGTEYTLSYTWDREEYIPPTVRDDGVCDEPGFSPVGTAFVIRGGTSKKYQPISLEAEKEFENLIMDYLRSHATPEDASEKPWKSEVTFKEKVSQKSVPTDHIVFVERYQNLAWGYQDNGSFIDCWGNVYEFDYSDRGSMSEEEFQQALWETYCDTEPVRKEVCDSDKLFEILLKDIDKIDREAEVSQKHTACDAGQRALYVCDSDFELIELCSKGDVEKRLQDRTAKKLCKFYDKITRGIH